MNTPDPLVVGVDGRPASLRAVAWAALEADLRRLPVHLVAVVPADAADPAAAVRRAHGDLVAARHVALASAAVVTSTEVTEGLPAPALTRHARTAPLLVVGSDGLGPEGPTSGTVGSAVVASASCPVVVVPGDRNPGRHAGEVVVAVDPTSPEDLRARAVAVAADVARGWARPLLVAVVLPGAHRAPDVGVARRAFDACRDGVPPGVRVHEVLAHGDPAEELLALTGPSTGLLVLGAGGDTPGAGGTVGDVARGRARCPVAIVPARVPTAAAVAGGTV